MLAIEAVGILGALSPSLLNDNFNVLFPEAIDFLGKAAEPQEKEEALELIGRPLTLTLPPSDEQPSHSHALVFPTLSQSATAATAASARLLIKPTHTLPFYEEVGKKLIETFHQASGLIFESSLIVMNLYSCYLSTSSHWENSNAEVTQKTSQIISSLIETIYKWLSANLATTTLNAHVSIVSNLSKILVNAPLSVLTPHGVQLYHLYIKLIDQDKEELQNPTKEAYRLFGKLKANVIEGLSPCIRSIGGHNFLPLIDDFLAHSLDTLDEASALYDLVFVLFQEEREKLEKIYLAKVLHVVLGDLGKHHKILSKRNTIQVIGQIAECVGNLFEPYVDEVLPSLLKLLVDSVVEVGDEVMVTIGQILKALVQSSKPDKYVVQILQTFHLVLLEKIEIKQPEDEEEDEEELIDITSTLVHECLGVLISLFQSPAVAKKVTTLAENEVKSIYDYLLENAPKDAFFEDDSIIRAHQAVLLSLLLITTYNKTSDVQKGINLLIASKRLATEHADEERSHECVVALLNLAGFISSSPSFKEIKGDVSALENELRAVSLDEKRSNEIRDQSLHAADLLLKYISS
eukprot:TRINITY_DN2254_c0_g1_i1.p1 TRINITY_DN2254_c0_g1~~TRINITY_DN2254_c0_g1_i1.p1  ORF type:complete len:577 (-),score=201.80 TRINITY_DN2254_c0_g1_i1:74-1804(-)